MSDKSQPTARWSTSISITTKSTGSTNQTIPLINIRKKLFRQSANSQQPFSQRRAKTKHDIEELFKLYYSNNIKFDTFQRQIVTGTRIPTAQTSSSFQNNLTNSSTNTFNSKHSFNRKELSSTDLDCNEPTKQPPKKRAAPIRIENNSTTDSPVSLNRSPPITTPVISNLPIKSPTTQQEELCDSSLVKSVSFVGNFSNETHENINTKNYKLNMTQRPTSSVLTMPPAPPPPSLLAMNYNNNQKDPTALSQTSSTTMESAQQQQNHPVVVNGSAMIVRERSPKKQRTKSNMAMAPTVSLPQSPTKTRSPSICNPLSIQPDMPDLPVFVGGQRVVSIPSKCSRYVLVTFPEAPLRYNTPSYVERLLLPERFPTLFHNIVHSYDHHLTTSIQHNRNAK